MARTPNPTRLFRNAGCLLSFQLHCQCERSSSSHIPPHQVGCCFSPNGAPWERPAPSSWHIRIGQVGSILISLDFIPPLLLPAGSHCCKPHASCSRPPWQCELGAQLVSDAPAAGCLGSERVCRVFWFVASAEAHKQAQAQKYNLICCLLLFIKENKASVLFRSKWDLHHGALTLLLFIHCYYFMYLVVF